MSWLWFQQQGHNFKKCNINGLNWQYFKYFKYWNFIEVWLCIIAGIAINKDGIIYFADGANIRMIDKDNKVHTVIGQQGQPKEWKPIPCEGVISVDKVRLTISNLLSPMGT